MAEFLVRIRDKVDHNPMLLGEREVVCVCPDGWKWSQIEQKNPDWRILKVPGMTVDEGSVFLAPEPVDASKYIPRRRAFKIDPAALPADALKLSDDKRVEAVVEVPKLALEASKTVREPLPRLDVIAPVDVIVKAASKGKK
jgi:hypothetical protein